MWVLNISTVLVLPLMERDNPLSVGTILLSLFLLLFLLFPTFRVDLLTEYYYYYYYWRGFNGWCTAVMCLCRGKSGDWTGLGNWILIGSHNWVMALEVVVVGPNLVMGRHLWPNGRDTLSMSRTNKEFPLSESECGVHLLIELNWRCRWWPEEDVDMVCDMRG